MRKNYLTKMLQRAARVKSAILLIERAESRQEELYYGTTRLPRYEGIWKNNKLLVLEHNVMEDYQKYRKVCLDNKKVLNVYRKMGIPGLYVYLEKINRHIRGYIWGNIVKQSEFDKFYHKGNDCDCCDNQYRTGRDGDEWGCHCFDEGKECHFTEII